MAQNDFFPIVYRILAALYKNLKEDNKNDKGLFDTTLYGCKEPFLNYILQFLIDEGYVDKVKYTFYDNKINFSDLTEMRITHKGIEYLQYNSIMEKTKLFFKDIKASIPFI